MDSPADKSIIIGIDPASQSIGVCAVRRYDAAPLFAQTIHVRGDVFSRLIRLSTELTSWFTHLSVQDYTIHAFGIEDPAQGLGRNGQNRHDTAFVLGRAFHAVQLACYDHAVRLGQSIPMIEVLPRESSQAVGCSASATKLMRNMQCALVSGGRYTITNQRTNDGYCDGGPLHRSNPDALDAFAAACAAWGKLRAVQQESRHDPPSAVRQGDRPVVRKRRSARAD